MSIPRKVKNIVGLRFGKLVVVEFHELRIMKDNHRRAFWKCRCDCGNTTVVLSAALAYGNSTTCGCGKAKGHVKHGHARAGNTSKEYFAWESMRRRCSDTTHTHAKYYSLRGVVVCDEWSDFSTFYKDMGSCPPGCNEIDRIDNNKGYSPENCRWVSRLQQLRNTSRCRWWHVNGVTYESLSHASKCLGIPRATIRYWCNGEQRGNKIYKKRNDCWSEMKYQSTEVVK